MAYEFYVSIEGTKQGKFKGESGRERWKDKIPASSFSYQVDVFSGASGAQVIGKRTHQPLTIIKHWGAASPQLFQALVTSEIIKTVLLEFVKTTNDGEEQVVHTIQLNNARVVRFQAYVKEGPNKEDPEWEEVSFHFERIQIENKPGKTSASDDVKPGN